MGGIAFDAKQLAEFFRIGGSLGIAFELGQRERRRLDVIAVQQRALVTNFRRGQFGQVLIGILSS